MAGRSGPTAADVLLVEDDRGDVMMISEAFRQSETGVRVHVVGDGEQALRFLRRGAGYEQAARPALILVDLDLPRRDGLEVLAALRADRTLAAAIPVVVLTMSRAEQHIRRSYELGAAAYLVKPPDFTSFAAVIRQVTARFLVRAAAAESPALHGEGPGSGRVARRSVSLRSPTGTAPGC